MKRRITATVLGLAGLLAVAACSDSARDATHDDTNAYRTRSYNAWDVIIDLDGYRNIATQCDPYQEGKRLYVPTKTDGSGFFLLVDDPTCHTADQAAGVTDRR